MLKKGVLFLRQVFTLEDLVKLRLLVNLVLLLRILGLVLQLHDLPCDLFYWLYILLTSCYGLVK